MLVVREGRKGIVEKPTLTQYGVVTEVVANRTGVKTENNRGKFL